MRERYLSTGFIGLGYTHEWMGTYNGTKQVFFPCRLDETICNIYLQGEMQGYADRTEETAGHPSYSNLLGRVCLGTEQFCVWIYQHHNWYDNLNQPKYDRMIRHLQIEHITAIDALSHIQVEKALISHILLQTKPASPPPPSPDILDIEHKCDNGNITCYSLGLKSGLVDGRDDRLNGHISYTLDGGCKVSGQHSPNYCYGYMLGYNKGFGRQINYTGADVGGEQGVSSNPSIACTVSTLFCNAYNHGYHMAYHYNIPYWAGYTVGMNFADHLIDICHEEDNAKIAGHHTAQYKSGWLDGYEDATGAASNDDGSYGAKGCKKYY
jgi:hypothetical protein